MIVTGCRETRACRIVELGLRVIRGNCRSAVTRAACERFFAEVAAFVDFQHVDRNVFGAQIEKFADGLFPRVARLVRKASYEIHADVVESGCAEDLCGAPDISAAMHAACGLEFAVVERLDAEADAIEASYGPGFGFFGCDCFGIGFEGNFGSLE